MSCVYCLVAALQFFCVLRSVTGEEYSYIAQIGEDGVIHCCTPVHNEHPKGMSIESSATIAFSVIGGIGATMFLCAICIHCCRKKDTRGKTYRAPIQRVSRQPIQLNVHNLQQPVTPLASQRVSQQLIHVGVHNFQQPVTSLASAPTVTHTEGPTAPPSQVEEAPPSYEAAVTCQNYSKEIPYNSAYKQ